MPVNKIITMMSDQYVSKMKEIKSKKAHAEREQERRFEKLI
ncbi:hypothetical protein [Vibrio bathopelagicus]